MTRTRRSRERSRHHHLPLWEGRTLSLLALVGIFCSTYLTYAHYRLHADPAWQSICAIGERLNCDKVISSEFGSLGNLPISLIGAWFYSLVGIAALAGRSKTLTLLHSPALAILGASLSAVAISVALALISFAIGAVCLFCVGLHVVNCALLAISWRAQRTTGESLTQAMRRERRYWRRRESALIGYFCVTAIPLVIASVGFSLGTDTGLCDRATALRRTDATLPLLLEIFVDYRCPHCLALEKRIQPLRDTSQFVVRTRHFPLDNACNPQVKQVGHPGACLQARAAICAEAEGKFREYSDRLFASAPADRDAVVADAVALGIDGFAFQACLESEATKKKLENDITNAIARGVHGTPAIFLNRERYLHKATEADISCLRRLLITANTH